MQIKIKGERKSKKTKLEFFSPGGQNRALDEVFEAAGGREFFEEFEQLPGGNVWECSRETFDAWTEILSCASEFEKIVAIRVETRGFEEIAAWVEDFVTPRGGPRGRAACLAHWRAVLEDIKRDFPAGLPQWSDRDAAELKKFFAACSESVLPEDLTGRVRVSLAPLGDELATEWFLADNKKEVATGGVRGVRGVYWGRVLFRPDLEDSERDIYQEVAAIDRGAYRVLLVR